MNQLSFKTVKNAWAKSLSVLDNPYVNLTLVIVLILYSSKMFGNINEVINGLYKYNFIKLLVLLIIAYVAPKDTNIAILLAISYVMSLKNMNMENFIAAGLKTIGSNTSNTNKETVKNICDSVKYLQKALDIYVTINSGLNDIIKSIKDLNDPDLNNINITLTTLNGKFKPIIDSLKNSINAQSKGQNCIIDKPPVKISSLQDTINTILTKDNTNTNAKISCNNPSITANDNLLLSLASIADNIRVYNNSADKGLGLTVTCMAINNSITSIISNINTFLIGTSDSIADPNAKKIIEALEIANTGINANIKYGNELVQKYVSQILPTLCSIVNDKTYQNLIKNLPDNCKNNVASQLSMLIEPRFDKYTTYFTQAQIKSLASSMKSSVLSKINARNILNPNAEWLKSCDISESTTTTTTTIPSSNNAPSLTKTMTINNNINNNIYYKGVVEVGNILNNKSTNKPSNDFGKGLLIAYKTFYKDDNTPLPVTDKIIDDVAKDIVENNKNVPDLSIGYAVAIVVVKIYYNRLNFMAEINNKTDYFNNINFINNTTINIIKIVSKALINKNITAQAEAIGLATGMNATEYIYDRYSINGFENFNDKDFEKIAINTKNVVSKNVKIKDAPELAKSYTNGSLIVRAMFSTESKNLKINYSVINDFTQKDKGIIYAQGIFNGVNIKDSDSFTSVDHNLGNIFLTPGWPWL